MSPSERAQWVDVLVKRLFDADIRRLNKHITELNQANRSAFKDFSLCGFILNAVTYMDLTEVDKLRQGGMQIGGIKSRYRPLHESLEKEAQYFSEVLDSINEDRNEIKQVVILLLGQACTVQELRDAIPECLMNLMPELAMFPRKIQNCDYLIRTDKYAMKAYEKTLPKLEAYSVMGMML